MKLFLALDVAFKSFITPAALVKAGLKTGGGLRGDLVSWLNILLPRGEGTDEDDGIPSMGKFLLQLFRERPEKKKKKTDLKTLNKLTNDACEECRDKKASE